MALVIALAITTGFRNTLQKNLLGIYAHVNVLQKNGAGVENWRELRQKLSRIPHVIGAAPVLYGGMFAKGPRQAKGISLQGIDVGTELTVSDTLKHLKEGSIEPLKVQSAIPAILIGSRLSDEIGLPVHSVFTIMSPQGNLTPFGAVPSYQDFRVAGIFESGFYDFDAGWAYTSLTSAQRLLQIGDEVNGIELRLDNLEL